MLFSTMHGLMLRLNLFVAIKLFPYMRIQPPRPQSQAISSAACSTRTDPMPPWCDAVTHMIDSLTSTRNSAATQPPSKRSSSGLKIPVGDINKTPIRVYANRLDVIASAGRDGTVRVWDTRTTGSRDPQGGNGRLLIFTESHHSQSVHYHKPAQTIVNAHSTLFESGRPSKVVELRRSCHSHSLYAQNHSFPTRAVTSLVFMRDPNYLSSSGADG